MKQIFWWRAEVLVFHSHSQDMLELQHFLTVTMDFEFPGFENNVYSPIIKSFRKNSRMRLAELPDTLQQNWEERVSLWPALPNLRLATLGQSLQRHRSGGLGGFGS